MYFDSWEIAKGKLEIGENPLLGARREINEEMGANMVLESPEYLGSANFSLRTPQKHPRLKTLHVYLFHCTDCSTEFNLATHEGIIDAQWVDVNTAMRLVSYRSLAHIMYRMRQVLTNKGTASLGSSVDLTSSKR